MGQLTLCLFLSLALNLFFILFGSYSVIKEWRDNLLRALPDKYTIRIERGLVLETTYNERECMKIIIMKMKDDLEDSGFMLSSYEEPENYHKVLVIEKDKNGSKRIS